MLRHLWIEHFKAWESTENIELAPISVFLGTNSSGKSSIFQLLMTLKQTVQDPDPNTVLNTGDEKTIVDLGQPIHMLYRHDASRPLWFCYDWDVDASLKAKLNDEIGDNVFFACGLSVKKSGEPFKVDSFIYERVRQNRYVWSIELAAVNNKTPSNRNDKPLYEMNIRTSEPHSIERTFPVTPVRFYGFSDETILRCPGVPLLSDLNTIHARLFSNMFYLGPLRDRTSRLYAWKGNNPSDVGIDGSKAVFAMLSARLDFRKFELPDGASEDEIDVAVAKLLKKMGLIEQFRVQKIAPERPEYEVQVQIKGSHVWADLPDVGCGVSQVLPVLVELFHAPPGSIILIEQPELHLHPSAQAALADVMIDAVRAKENGKPRNIQLLIETHSEHFLRRLQRRVAENKVIDESMVRCYFADTATDPFQLRKLEMDPYGNILNWPDGFFGDMAGDIFQQTREAFRRKKDEYEHKVENH